MTASAPKFRLNLYVERAYVRRLREVARTQGISQSALMAAALTAFLSPEDQQLREAAVAKRLDRLSSQFERLERDQTILLETVALFIRYELSVATAVPEGHQDAARAVGKARFEKFIAQLARHLQRGGSVLRDLHTQIYPEDAASSDDVSSAGDEPRSDA